MNKFIIFAFCLFLSTGIFAQAQKGYVYLKNGTVLKGKYIFMGDSAQIQIHSGGNRWIFNSDEIERLGAHREKNPDVLPRDPLYSNWFFRSEIGVLAGSEENSQTAPFAFSASLDYLLNPQVAVGAGFGLEFLKETYLPLFLNVEYKFRNAYSSPFLFLKSGYQLPLQDSQEVYYPNYDMPTTNIWPGPRPGPTLKETDTQGGFLINPGLGYQNMFSPGFGMTFSFGYQFTRLNYKADDDYKLQLDYNRLSLKIGIIFN